MNDTIVPVGTKNEMTSLYRVYYKCNDKTYLAYGFFSSNGQFALFRDQKCAELIGTCTEDRCEYFEQIGKTKLCPVMHTPVTIAKLSLLELHEQDDNFFQMSLF